ncbi:MAG: hypothetical protein NT154_29350 [Verrucomicrobia bacterium]|nr:hypothetical protein [Verrucomicrobiota bacterium]
MESNGNPPTGGVPPQSPVSLPPVIGTPPPPLAAEPARKPGVVRPVLTFLLSLCLGLFLADGVVSLVDDSLILFLGVHLLTAVRGIVFLCALLAAIAVYGLMGLTPLVPKRLFLPVTLFNPVAALAVIPFAIYCYGRLAQFSWVVSLCQVLFGLAVLYRVQGGLKFRWPLVADHKLGTRRFSWLNLAAFLLVNFCVVLPLALAYLALCASLAVDYVSDGFVALRPGGLTVRMREFVRNDGKKVRLIPMVHVGEADFYQKVAQSFPTNSIILMEGVTDDGNLLTNKITYKRMAKTLKLTEQREVFAPIRGRMVRADVDVGLFSTNTIGFLNLIMLVHSKGLTAETVLALLQYSPPPHFEEQLIDDLLRKRNRYLVNEIQARLPQSEHIIVPWGAAHMPGIADGIQSAGFHVCASREYIVIRFRAGNRNP